MKKNKKYEKNKKIIAALFFIILIGISIKLFWIVPSIKGMHFQYLYLVPFILCIFLSLLIRKKRSIEMDSYAIGNLLLSKALQEKINLSKIAKIINIRSMIQEKKLEKYDKKNDDLEREKFLRLVLNKKEWDFDGLVDEFIRRYGNKENYKEIIDELEKEYNFEKTELEQENKKTPKQRRLKPFFLRKFIKNKRK